MRVLLVSDNRLWLERLDEAFDMLRDSKEQENTVQVAHSSREALQVILNDPPLCDVVIILMEFLQSEGEIPIKIRDYAGAYLAATIRTTGFTGPVLLASNYVHRHALRLASLCANETFGAADIGEITIRAQELYKG